MDSIHAQLRTINNIAFIFDYVYLKRLFEFIITGKLTCKNIEDKDGDKETLYVLL